MGLRVHAGHQNAGHARHQNSVHGAHQKPSQGLPSSNVHSIEQAFEHRTCIRSNKRSIRLPLVERAFDAKLLRTFKEKNANFASFSTLARVTS
jgi:hypothetical protein